MVTVASATSRSALITPLMEMNIVPPELATNSAEAEEQVTPAAERIVDSIRELPPNPPH